VLILVYLFIKKKKTLESNFGVMPACIFRIFITSSPDVRIFRLATNNVLSQVTVSFYCQDFVGSLNFTGMKKFHATALAQFKQADNLFND